MADGLDEFFPRSGGGDRPEVFWRAFITKAPNSVNGEMFAAPIGSSLEDGPLLGWRPRVVPNPDENETDDPNYSPFILRFPERDDLALVTEDDDGNYWCLEWIPNA